MYEADKLTGGHVIMLGPGNEKAAEEALAAWPGGLQIGGGIHAGNAAEWLDKGAAAVIVTSYVFQNGRVHEERLREMVAAVGPEHLVLDLSCRKRGDEYFIVTDRWQKFTSVAITEKNLAYLFSDSNSVILLRTAASSVLISCSYFFKDAKPDSFNRFSLNLPVPRQPQVQISINASRQSFIAFSSIE